MSTGQPLVGVMLSPKGVALMQGAWAERFRRIDLEAKAVGARLCCFTPGGVDLAAGLVDGWTRLGGAWVKARLPMPEVVYNRAAFPTAADRAPARAVRRQMARHYGVVFLNGANTFSKWAVHEALRFFPETAGLAPDSIWFAAPEDLLAMAERHPVIFAKADGGSHGSDVVKISAADGGFDLRGQVGGGFAQERFASATQVLAFLTLAGSRRDWILQQGIDLPQLEERILDVRVILQKNGHARWEVPLVLLRWGRKGQVAANMSQGGQPFPAPAFLEQYGHLVPELLEVEATAARAALDTAGALEARYGRLGEIGVDVGVDRQGRAWVFEANTKPVHPQVPDLPVPLERYPFHYAVWLAHRARGACATGMGPPGLL